MDTSDILKFIQRSKENKIQELDLSNKGLTSLPAEIGELTHLKILNLSYNNLTELPSSICNLISLEKLFLNRNHISRLPIGLSNLFDLIELDLSYNPLVKLPREIGHLCNLEFFDASYCELRTLPIEISNLINIKELNVDENPLTFPPQKVAKRGLYAIMHYLTMEKRKNEASRVMLQVFNMPEKIQPAFRQYIRYFNQMVSQANNKEVVFDMNFINQDFYQEMMLNAGVGGYLYDVMRYIQEKVDTIQTPESQKNENGNAMIDSRINEIKEKLYRFNESLENKIDDIRQIKLEIKGLSDLLDD